MLYLISLLLWFTPLSQNDTYETDHYIINDTNTEIAISVDYKDQSENPGQGSSMYSIPPGAAIVVSQESSSTGFVAPTSKYEFTLLSSGLDIDLNLESSWLFEEVTDHKARYQCTIKTEE